MPFITILRQEDAGPVRVVAGEARSSTRLAPSEEGTFGAAADPVMFEREVPDSTLALERLREALASSLVAGTEDTYDCPVPVLIRTLEMVAGELWPTRRVRCGDCYQYFKVPWPDRHRMYLVCPHCRNPVLNPAWDSA